MTNQDRFLTVREVATHFRVSGDTVRRWISAGVIQSINISIGKKPSYRILERSLSAIGKTQGKAKSTHPALVGLKEYI